MTSTYVFNPTCNCGHGMDDHNYPNDDEDPDKETVHGRCWLRDCPCTTFDKAENQDGK